MKHDIIDIVNNKIENILMNNYFLYKQSHRFSKIILNRVKTTVKPTYLNLELTTYCNSHCIFCTHDTLVGKFREKRYATIEEIRKNAMKLKELSRGMDNIHIIPVGLGEPLIHPDVDKIFKIIKEQFPNATIQINTNAIALKGKISDAIIDSEIDTLVCSLCFVDKNDYKTNMMTDKYDEVIANIRTFLSVKGNRKPRVLIHIFERSENIGKMKRFVKLWKPYLNHNDRLILASFAPLTEPYDAPTDPKPCWALFETNTLMISLEGNIYPCCEGVWKPHDQTLSLGTIDEENEIILERWESIRQRHRERHYGTCSKCPALKL